MSLQSRYCIRLVNMVFYAHHGVLREEHRIGAKYEVDAGLHFDFYEAAKHDDITKTIDYGTVYQKIREILTLKKYCLIESVAFDIAHDLLRDFPMLEDVSIKVRKHNPPVDGICDYAEADVSLKRH